MELSEAKGLVKSLRNRYWFGHHTPRECILGADGVGHGNVHPAARLIAACRNANAMIEALEDIQDSLDEAKIDLEDAKTVLLGLNTKRNEIRLRKASRKVERLQAMHDERMPCLVAYAEHINKLVPLVTSQYDHVDQAMDDIWMSRVAYDAISRNHPLGQDLKVAILDESKKHEILDLLQMPKYVLDQNGNRVPLTVPDADMINTTLEDYKSKVARLGGKNG